MIRPEIRYERSLKRNGVESTTGPDNPQGLANYRTYGAYDNGTRQNQFTFAVDLTFHF
jgi:hypothetical protein